MCFQRCHLRSYTLSRYSGRGQGEGRAYTTSHFRLANNTLTPTLSRHTVRVGENNRKEAR